MGWRGLTKTVHNGVYQPRSQGRSSYCPPAASEERRSPTQQMWHVTSVCQGLSSLCLWGGKMRDPGNEVGSLSASHSQHNQNQMNRRLLSLKFLLVVYSVYCDYTNTWQSMLIYENITLFTLSSVAKASGAEH